MAGCNGVLTGISAIKLSGVICLPATSCAAWYCDSRQVAERRCHALRCARIEPTCAAGQAPTAPMICSMNSAASVTVFSVSFNLSSLEMLVTGFVAKIAPRESQYLVIGNFGVWPEERRFMARKILFLFLSGASAV